MGTIHEALDQTVFVLDGAALLLGDLLGPVWIRQVSIFYLAGTDKTGKADFSSSSGGASALRVT